MITQIHLNTLIMDNIVHNLNYIIMTSLKNFVAEQGFTAIYPKIRTNTKGYPFITFLTGNGPDSATNIYFSVNASAKLKEDKITLLKPIAKELIVTETINADGESRLKLAFHGESSYVDVADMF